MAEGGLVVRQLLRSPYRLRSVLVTAHGMGQLGEELDRVAAPVYVVDQPLIERVCAFHFHRGALASADRGPARTVEDVTGGAGLVVVAEGVNDHENLGALFRNAAAFGVGAVVLDPTTADPLYRRSIRVSMGHVLRTPFARAGAGDWPSRTLAALRDAGFEVLALTPAADAVDLRDVAPRPRQVLLVGAEGPGLTEPALAAADRRVRISTAPGVDSLNVATAAAIALHHLAS